MKQLELSLNKRLLIVEGGFMYYYNGSPLKYICKGTDIGEEIASTFTDSYYTCFVCGGDGRETCTNPDHGFISVLSFHDVGRVGCPVCGQDPYHKVKNGGECECCKGSGRLDSFEFSHEANEYAYDGEGHYHSALQAFISSIEASGYHWGESPYEKELDICNAYTDMFTIAKRARKYEEAKSRTFNPEKCIIFEIV